MHRRAATLGNVVTSCGHPSSEPPHPRRLEKLVYRFTKIIWLPFGRLLINILSLESVILKH